MTKELLEAFNSIILNSAKGLLDDDGVDENAATDLAQALVAEVERLYRPDEYLMAAARGVVEEWGSSNLVVAVNVLRETLEALEAEEITA